LGFFILVTPIQKTQIIKMELSILIKYPNSDLFMPEQHEVTSEGLVNTAVIFASSLTQ
jgi:hypothetical protein